MVLEIPSDLDFSLDSPSLQIASAQIAETMRSVMKTSSLMHAHIELERRPMGSTLRWIWFLRLALVS